MLLRGGGAAREEQAVGEAGAAQGDVRPAALGGQRCDSTYSLRPASPAW